MTFSTHAKFVLKNRVNAAANAVSTSFILWICGEHHFIPILVTHIVNCAEIASTTLCLDLIFINPGVRFSAYWWVISLCQISRIPSAWIMCWAYPYFLNPKDSCRSSSTWKLQGWTVLNLTISSCQRNASIGVISSQWDCLPLGIVCQLQLMSQVQY